MLLLPLLIGCNEYVAVVHVAAATAAKVACLRATSVADKNACCGTSIGRLPMS